jgi:hypothetical protein
MKARQKGTEYKVMVPDGHLPPASGSRHRESIFMCNFCIPVEIMTKAPKNRSFFAISRFKN